MTEIYLHIVARIATDIHAMRQYSSLDQEDKMRKKAILKLYRGEIDSSDEKGTKRSFEDDGFGQLGAEDYLQARTQFYLDKFKKRLPGMSRQKNTINLAMYIATGVSVLLGTGMIKNGNVRELPHI